MVCPQLDTHAALLTCAANLTLFHVGLRRFFGRTYTADPAQVAPGNQDGPQFDGDFIDPLASAGWLTNQLTNSLNGSSSGRVAV